MTGEDPIESRSTTPDRRCQKTRPWATIGRLLRDESAVTTLEYVVAGVAIALGAVAASRAIGSVLQSYLHRIYLVVTLPVP